jgi:hypothetical protein
VAVVADVRDAGAMLGLWENLAMV